MALINDNYLKLKSGYLFPQIARRVKAFQEKNPVAPLIRLGIGDVVLALPKAVIKAFREAVDEMAEPLTFHGYGPEQGYPFLIEAIIENDFKPRGVSLKPAEIFVSDGSKCDTGNIQEIFSLKNKIAVTDPVYPVYVDTNVMAGRGPITYLPATPENNFDPDPPKRKVDLIYLCSPNNPTGSAMTKNSLKKWVNYAKRNNAIILFDAAYEAYISDPSLPHSIYEIGGAKETAIEFRSFSKTAGFTGTRCAYTVIPEGLKAKDKKGKKTAVNPLWHRRQTTKFNGVSYPVQKAAAACYTPEGKQEIRELIDYYMNNARIIREGLSSIGLEVYGGINAPYLWVKTPGKIDSHGQARGNLSSERSEREGEAPPALPVEGATRAPVIDSWSFFDKLLTECHVVGTPGSGFGPAGEGYFRLSAFGFKEKVEEAVERIKTRLKV